MKKLLSLLLMLALLIPVSANAVTLSEMTFDELVALREKIAVELTKRPEWKEVTVPIGVWKVGEDIPEGHWVISAKKGLYSTITIGTELDALKQNIDTWKTQVYYSELLLSSDASYSSDFGNRESFDIELKNGYYVIVENGPAVFTPYIGKPTLGF